MKQLPLYLLPLTKHSESRAKSFLSVAYVQRELCFRKISKLSLTTRDFTRGVLLPGAN